MFLNVCRTCGEVFEAHHNTKYYCSDEHTPYKNPLMGWDNWRCMHKRCYDQRTNGYKNYGGQGIKVCDRWFDYKCFLEDMGLKPKPNSQVDRIDSEKDYSPENCRWVSPKRNIYNKSKTRKIIFEDKENTLSGWADELGFATSSLSLRIKNWGLEKALTTEHGSTGPKRS